MVNRQKLSGGDLPPFKLSALNLPQSRRGSGGVSKNHIYESSALSVLPEQCLKELYLFLNEIQGQEKLWAADKCFLETILCGCKFCEQAWKRKASAAIHSLDIYKHSQCSAIIHTLYYELEDKYFTSSYSAVRVYQHGGENTPVYAMVQVRNYSGKAARIRIKNQF